MKRILTLLAFGLGLSLVGLAQIALQPSDYQSPLGDTVVTVEVDLATLQGSYLVPPAEGANQSWDFRWLLLTLPFEDPELPETLPDFPTANSADQGLAPVLSPFNQGRTITQLEAEQLTPDAKVSVGQAIETSQAVPLACGTCTGADSVRFEPVVNLYETPDTLVRFPLSEGDAWTSSYTRQYDLTLFLPTFSLQGVSAQQTDSITATAEVVGWGMLTLPNLTRSGLQDFGVLLLKRSMTITRRYQVDGQPAPQALLDSLGTSEGEQVTLTFYDYWTPGLDRPTLSIIFDPGLPFPIYQVAGGNQAINLEPEGQFFPQGVSIDGQVRPYYLYVPPSYDGSQEVPLVVALHGYTANTLLMAWQSQFNHVADTAGFLVAYPQGELVTNAAPPPGLPPQGLGWNVGGILSSETDDVAYLDGVLDQIGQNFAVDSNRIYATGISNGGLMTSLLACERPERLAAVANVAGIGTENCTQADVLPTLVIHGTNDPIVPFEGDPSRGAPDVDSLVEALAGFNGCDAAPDSVNLPDIDPSDNTTVTRFDYGNCDENGDVVFYRVNNGSHVWDGTAPVPSFFIPVVGPNVNQDIHASVEIWQFFQRFERQASTSIAAPQGSAFGLNVYPNPSQGAWTVAFELPQASELQLLLYDQMGRKVHSLAEGVMAPGHHQLSGPADLPTGLYHLRLAVEGQTVSWVLLVE